MSTVIDDKIVSLQFDNKNFEKNVSTTMSTLDKLKSKLNFNGAEKSLNSLQKASEDVSFSRMEKSLYALEKRFSTFGIVGMRAISNITDSMMKFGTKTLSFVTNNIKTAGKQRAMNIERAHFQLQGLISDSTEVDKIMKQAMETVDGTAYRFDSAALAASQFAASGLRAGDLMKKGLRGITGVAAMTNSQYEDISRIFTQVSGQGRVLGQDLLQLSSRGLNAAATIADYLTEIGNGAKVTEAEVREMVSRGKIDFEIFASAMDKAFGEHAKKANDTVDGAFANVKAALSKIGELFYKPIIANKGPLVDLLNIIREKINEIKGAITPLIDMASGIAIKVINKLSSAISKISFKNNSWDKIKELIGKAGVDVEKFQNALTETAKQNGIDIDNLIQKYGSFEESLKSGWVSGKLVSDTLKNISKNAEKASTSQDSLNDKLKYFQDVVNRVWNGDFKNGEERFKLLSEAGYDYAKVQDLVNKTVDGHKLTLEDLSETQLESIGYTKEEIKQIHKLAEEAKKSGTSLNDLINKLDDLSTLDLLVDSISNIASMFNTLKECATKAWNEVFPKKENQKDIDVFHNIALAINNFTKSLVINEKTASKIIRVFKGLLSVFSILGKIISKTLTFGLNQVNKLLGIFGKLTGNVNLDLLDLFANLGDLLVSIDSWIGSNNLLNKSLEIIGKAVQKVSEFTNKMFNTFIKLPPVTNAIERIRTGFESLYDTIYSNFGPIIDAVNQFIQSLKKMEGVDFKTIFSGLTNIWHVIKETFAGHKGEFAEIGRNIFEGLKEGLKETFDTIIDTVVEIGKEMISKIKDVLGIHSPSTVFMEIGTNIVEGLAIGIQNALPILGEIMLGLGEFLTKSIKQLDLTDVLAIGGFLVVMKSANNLIKSLDSLSRSVTGFGEVTKSIAGVFKSISLTIDRSVNRYIDVKAMEARAAAFKSMALAVVEIAGALSLLSLIDPNRLWNAAGALSAIMGVMLVMVKSMGSVENIPDLTKFSVMIISIGIAIKLMSKSLSALSVMNWEEWIKAIGGLIVFMGSFAVLAHVITSFEADPADALKLKSAAVTFIGVAVAIKLLTKSLGVLGDMDVLSLIKSMTLIGAMIFGLYELTKHMNKLGTLNIDFAVFSSMILKIAGAFAILAIAFKIIGTIKSEDVWKSIGVMAAITAFMGAITLLSLACDNKIINFVGMGSMFVKLASSMILFGIAIKIIARIKNEDVLKSIGIIASIGLLMAAIMALSIFTGKWNKFNEMGNMFMKLGVAFAALGIAMRIISGLSHSEINKCITVVRKLSGFILALTAVSLFAGKNAALVGNMILKLTVALGALALVTRLLRGLDDQDIARGLVFINGCTVFFSALLVCSHFIGEHADKAANMLMKLTAPIVALSLAIIVLSSLDIEKLKVATTSLTVAMTSLSVMMGIAGHMKVDLKSFGSILAAVTILSGILWALSKLDVTSSIQNATALSILLIALSTSMHVMTNIPDVGRATFKSLRAVGMALGMVAIVLGLLSHFNCEPSIESATALSTLLISLTGVTVILSKFGSGSLAPAAEGAAALAAIILILSGTVASIVTAVGVMAVGLGAAFNKFESLGPSLDSGLEVLEKVFTSIGKMVSGFISGSLDFLPVLGEQLASFFESLQGIDPSSVNAIKSLSEAFRILVGSNILNNISNIFGMGLKPDSLKSNFQAVGDAIGSFAEGVSKIDETSIEKANMAAKVLEPIAKIEATLPRSGGLFQKIAGFKDVQGFGEGIEALGTGLSNFVKNLPEDILSQDVQAKIEAANTALQGLATISATIPDSSGEFLKNFVVFNNIPGFSTGLKSMGKGLTNFMAALTPEEANGPDIGKEEMRLRVENATAALNGLVEIANAIPDTSGEWLNKIITFNNTEAFATGIESLGDALGVFVEKIPDLTATGENDPKAKTESAIEILNSLAKFADAIPDEGFQTLIEKLLNMGNISQFGSQLDALGMGLKKFAGWASQIENVEQAVKASEMINVLVKSMKKLEGYTGKGVSAFVESINKLGNANIKGFIDNFGGGAAEKLSKVGSSMANSIVKGVKSKSDALSTALNTLVSTAAATVKSGPMKESGSKVGKAFVKAVSDKSSSAKKAGIKLNDAGAAGAGDDTTGFYNAGLACVEGFASGIDQNTYIATAKARAMAQAASQAAREALDINSPSKVFRRIGYSVPEGFAQGIDRMKHLVLTSVSNMSTDAIYSSKNALNSIALLSDSDIKPTIRPVIDLSDVEKGAGRLNNLLNFDPIATTVSAQAIGSKVYNKHDSNAQIIDSLKDLKKTLSESNSGNSYNINGITYDDGSNVSNAVKELIRAAKIERRV